MEQTLLQSLTADREVSVQCFGKPIASFMGLREPKRSDETKEILSAVTCGDAPVAVSDAEPDAELALHELKAEAYVGTCNVVLGKDAAGEMNTFALYMLDRPTGKVTRTLTGEVSEELESIVFDLPPSSDPELEDYLADDQLIIRFEELFFQVFPENL